MQVDLKGKVALVTGAATGIGRAIADVFARNGANVVYADINPVEGTLQNGAIVIRMDVSSPDEVESGVASAVERFGRLDILVNNAGINTLEHRVNFDQFP